MEISIHAQGFLPTDSLRGHVRSRLQNAGSSVRSKIRSVRVLLLPGTRIGHAGACSGPKICRLVADVAGVGQVETEAQDYDLYRAVGRAASRLSAPQEAMRDGKRNRRRARMED